MTTKPRSRKKAAAPQRKMPVRRRWIPLAELPSDRREFYEEIGEEVPSFEGWEVQCRIGLIMGVYNETMRTMQRMGQVERDSKEESFEPSIDEMGAASEAFTSMINFCRAHVSDWNFVDEEGEPIPYSNEAWIQLDSDLIMCTFGAIQNQTQKAPKATG